MKKRILKTEITSLKKEIKDLKMERPARVKFPQEDEECDLQHQNLHLEKTPVRIQKTKKGSLEELGTHSCKSK